MYPEMSCAEVREETRAEAYRVEVERRAAVIEQRLMGDDIDDVIWDLVTAERAEQETVAEALIRFWSRSSDADNGCDVLDAARRMRTELAPLISARAAVMAEAGAILEIERESGGPDYD